MLWSGFIVTGISVQAVCDKFIECIYAELLCRSKYLLKHKNPRECGRRGFPRRTLLAQAVQACEMRKYEFVDKRSRQEIHKLWASTVGVHRRDTRPKDDGLRARHRAAMQSEQEVAEESEFPTEEDNAGACSKERVELAEEIAQAKREHWQEQAEEFTMRREAERDTAREIAPAEEGHRAEQEAQIVKAAKHKLRSVCGDALASIRQEM